MNVNCRKAAIRRQSHQPNRVIPAGEQSSSRAAHRGNGKRFIVTADEKLTAFLELERVTRESFRFLRCE
jgi:hypothetical protein